MRLVSVIYGPQPFRAAWIHFLSTIMHIALRKILMKAIQMCTLHAHVKYMLRVSLKEHMWPQPVIPFNYYVEYEHLPPADHPHPNTRADSLIWMIHLCIMGIKVYNRIKKPVIPKVKDTSFSKCGCGENRLRILRLTIPNLRWGGGGGQSKIIARLE